MTRLTGTADISGGPDPTAAMYNLTVFQDVLYFSATDQPHGQEPWVSDGTMAGTRMLADLSPGTRSTSVAAFQSWGDSVVFSAVDEETGLKLWKTDGTTDGTAELVTIATTETYPLPQFTLLPAFATIDDRLFFSDFPEPGVARLRMLTESSPEPITVIEQLGSFSVEMVVHQGQVYFTNYTDQTGYELWHTDGTALGTGMVTDFEANAIYSAPFNLTVAGDNLFFMADDGIHGTEFWILPDNRPRVQFFKTGIVTTEGGPSVSIDVEFVNSAPLSEPLTVQLTALGGLATPDDYNVVDAIVFPAGSESGTRVSVQVKASSDLLVEGTESVDIGLVVDSASVFVSSEPLTVTIPDANKATIGFFGLPATMFERDATMELQFLLSTTPAHSVLQREATAVFNVDPFPDFNDLVFPSNSISFAAGAKNADIASLSLAIRPNDSYSPSTRVELNSTTSNVSIDYSHDLGTISIFDDDYPQYAVQAPAAMRTSEQGGQFSFSVSLTTIPSASVTLRMIVSNADEAKLSASTLVFTPENAMLPQAVVVTGVDDDELDGDQTVWITFETSETNEIAYLGPPNPLTFINLDDDAAPHQNVLEPLDVNGNSEITALDALVVINVLNRFGGSKSSVDEPWTDDWASPSYADVNGDRRVSAMDAMIIINHLNTTGYVAEGGLVSTASFLWLENVDQVLASWIKWKSENVIETTHPTA